MAACPPDTSPEEIMARGYRRLGRATQGTAEVSMETVPTLERLEADFLAYQASRNLSPYTIRNYRSTFGSLRRFCHAEGLDPDAGDLTTEFFRRYQTWLLAQPLDVPRHGSDQRRGGAVAARMRQLKAFCAWLSEEGEIEQPVKFALPKTAFRQLEVLIEAQVEAIFRSRHLSGDAAVAKRNRALISLLLDSGLRLAEIAGIEDADLFLQAGWVRVVGKGNRERLAPFSATTRAALEAWLAARDADPIEVTGPGRGKTFELGREGVRGVVKRIGTDTGIPLRCHLFRHTSATTMVKRGMDVATLRKILGHSSIAITQVYLHLRQEEIKEKHTAFSPMDHFAPAPLPKKRRTLGRRAA